jgi:uncharacterized lipoprotein YehR (DUF1307 family)
MVHTKEKLKETAEILNSLTDEYSDYYRVRDNTDLESINEKIWSKGYIEPFSCDYITDMFDNTVDMRKLMKAPRKKEYAAMHYMCDELPVYSVYYKKDDEIFREKLYINSSERRIELLFSCPQHILLQLSLTVFDEKGRPAEYSSIKISPKGLKMINAAVYTYEGDRIVKAESICDLNPETAIIMYDDEAFDPEYRLQSKYMNPPDVSDYDFHYTDNAAETFTRTDYEYKRVHKNTWKLRRGIIKRYNECGIEWFGEE